MSTHRSPTQLSLPLNTAPRLPSKSATSMRVLSCDRLPMLGSMKPFVTACAMSFPCHQLMPNLRWTGPKSPSSERRMYWVVSSLSSRGTYRPRNHSDKSARHSGQARWLLV